MYNIKVDKFYPQNYKYDMSRFMRYDSTDRIYDILDSEFIRQVRNLPIYGVRTITYEEGSPSLVTELIYGYFNWQYWWILMEINDLTDPEDLVNGFQLKYPSLSTLDTFFSTLNPRLN